MAKKRTAGGNTAQVEAPSTIKPVKETAPAASTAAPDEDFWKTDDSGSTFEPISEIQIGGESKALKETREARTVETEEPESDVSKLIKGVQALKLRDYAKPGGKVTLADEASIRHAGILDVSSHLGRVVENLRRTIPAVQDGKVDPIFDQIHGVIDEADAHLGQASIEYSRGHHGVSYLDKHPGMDNKILPGHGLATLRGKGSAVRNLLSRGGATVPAEDRLIPKGSINLTRRAADLLITANSAIRDLTAKARAQASVQGFEAPEIHDKDGILANKIDKDTNDFANLLDMHHAMSPGATGPALGQAMTEARKEELKRLTPSVLSSMGLRQIASQKLSDITASFDRRKNAVKTFAAAKLQQHTLQRKITDYAFERIFGSKLRANEAAQEAQRGVVAQQNNVEKARIAAIRQQNPITPLFPDAEVPSNVKDILAARSSTVKLESRPILSDNEDTKTVRSYLDKIGEGTAPGTIDTPFKEIASPAPFETDAQADARKKIAKVNYLDLEHPEAQAAIDSMSKLVQASGNTELIDRFNAHRELLTHHAKLARLNKDETTGAFVKQGEAAAQVLRLKTGTISKTNDVGYASNKFGDYGPPTITEDGSMIDPNPRERVKTNPTHVYQAAPNVMSDSPSDSIQELKVNTDAENRDATPPDLSHPYFEKPTIYKDKLGNQFVREGKFDGQIEDLQTQIGNEKDQTNKSRLMAELEGVKQQAYQARQGLMDKFTPEGKNNKRYVGVRALHAADDAFIAASDKLKSMNSRPLFGGKLVGSLPDLKRSLFHLHSEAATDSLRQMISLVRDSAPQEIKSTLTQSELPENSGIQAREFKPTLPYPELEDRATLKGRFDAISGVGTAENPNVEILKDKSGAPVDYKRARRGSRKVAFSDSLGRQYAWGTSFAPPETEGEFRERENAPAAPTRKSRRKGSTSAASIPAGTTEESLRIQQNREDEEKQRREQADRLSPSAELRPLFTSNMANVRGLLPLGNNSAPILSNSGKSAIVPGVGVVPVPEPTNKKGRKKAGKRTKVSTQELGLSTANEYEPIQELNIDSLIRGTNAATINSNKAPTMEAPDVTENENVNLGRQFITTKTTDQVAAEQEGNQTFDTETEGLLKEISKKRK
jgi:hypothetical protein